MLIERRYNRERAVEYARRWAFSRSPLFESYNGIGGDCTNFVSQCVYAGSCVMNYTRDFGWYYSSPMNRAPAWTGVEFFYNFMTSNEGVGPLPSSACPSGSTTLPRSSSPTGTLAILPTRLTRLPASI